MCFLSRFVHLFCRTRCNFAKLQAGETLFSPKLSWIFAGSSRNFRDSEAALETPTGPTFTPPEVARAGATLVAAVDAAKAPIGERVGPTFRWTTPMVLRRSDPQRGRRQDGTQQEPAQVVVGVLGARVLVVVVQGAACTLLHRRVLHHRRRRRRGRVRAALSHRHFGLHGTALGRCARDDATQDLFSAEAGAARARQRPPAGRSLAGEKLAVSFRKLQKLREVLPGWSLGRIAPSRRPFEAP